MSSNSKRRRSSAGSVSVPRWRSWSRTRKVYATAAAAFAFILLGAFGMNLAGTGHAMDGCYGASGGNESAYFWDGFHVKKFPSKSGPDANATQYNPEAQLTLGPGCHTIGGQVQCFGSDATVYDGPNNIYHNNWWVYFSDRHGWVNEVHAADTTTSVDYGNNARAWPYSQVPLWSGC